MSTSSHSSLSLLVPASLLPAEGHDEEFRFTEGNGHTITQLMSALRTMGGDAPHFTLRPGCVELPANMESASFLNGVTLQNDATSSATEIEVQPNSTEVDWSDLAEKVTSRMEDPHFLATTSEMTRVFLEETRRALHQVTADFTGESVPLVSVAVGDEDSVTITFYGVWQADPESSSSLNGNFPVRSLQSGEIGALESCLLLSEPEAEGRGLMEAVLSLSMLAMVFQDPMNTAPLPAPTVLSQQMELVETADMDSVSEVLLVKSQKLKQPPPLIYPNVIKDVQGCEHKVIVDISGQRAYVFIDNRLAFETPISSASRGRHTPRGTFTITEKIRSGKRSTIYKSLMPYWMRLDQSAIGMHTGQLPGYPASHGCMRMPDESAKFVFDLVPKGTIVQVVDSLKPAVVEPAPAVLATR